MQNIQIESDHGSLAKREAKKTKVMSIPSHERKFENSMINFKVSKILISAHLGVFIKWTSSWNFLKKKPKMRSFIEKPQDEQKLEFLKP